MHLTGCLEPVALPPEQKIPVRVTIVDSLSTPLSSLQMLPGESTCLYANLSVEAATNEIRYFWAINGTVIATGDSLCIHATYVGIDTLTIFATDPSKGQVRDTLPVTTNSPPQFFTDPVFFSPASDTMIPLASPQGIAFAWSVFDPDPDEDLVFTLYLGLNSNWIDTVFSKSTNGIYYNQDLLPNQTYTWKLIVHDKLGASDTSSTFTFSTLGNP